MSIQLNHIIVPAKEKWSSANFLAGILGLEVASQWARSQHCGPAMEWRSIVDAAEFETHHCAFLVGEEECESALAELLVKRVVFNADFMSKKVGVINHIYGGRGVYFDSPERHLFEIITRPYGPTPEM